MDPVTNPFAPGAGTPPPELAGRDELRETVRVAIEYEDIEVGFDFDPEPGLADNGDLEHDLQALLEAAGAAAQKAGTALVMFLDEMQYVQEEELAALITSLHRTAQRRLPVALVGAGLPQLPGRMGRAKSYA